MLDRRSTKGLRLGQLARIMSQTPDLREAFSALHAGLRLETGADARQSILVTSTQPQEGKSTVASCLALTASLAGQSVLLIDGDLRRPWLGSAIGISDTIGLGEVLSGEVQPEETIHTADPFEHAPHAGRLCVMSAGRKSSSFLPAVDWARARATFRTVSQHYGIVLLDSPPILAASDALLFAGLVDAVLLVIGAGSADREDVLRAKEQLAPTGTPVVGAVLNMFDPKLHGPSAQPYSGYYLDPRGGAGADR